MTKDLFNNTKIKVTPEQSEKVQKLAFENGLSWPGKQRQILYTDRPYLFFYSDNEIRWGSLFSGDDDFSSHPNREIQYSDLFPEESKEAEQPPSNDLSKWSIADLWAIIQYTEWKCGHANTSRCNAAQEELRKRT